MCFLSLHPNQLPKIYNRIREKNYFLSFVLVVSFGVGSDFLTGGNLRLVEAARLGLIVLVLLRLLLAVATEFFEAVSSLPSTMAGFTESRGVAVANPATAKVSLCSKLLENDSKCRISNFQIWHFSPIFVLFRVTCLVTLFDRKHQVFKKSPKLPFLAFFINFCTLKM